MDRDEMYLQVATKVERTYLHNGPEAIKEFDRLLNASDGRLQATFRRIADYLLTTNDGKFDEFLVATLYDFVRLEELIVP